uniref:Complex I-B15 n=1 Tax=Amphimedon queenslandica TaxID=400682 RepID=A0A1X7VIU3_AMPQE
MASQKWISRPEKPPEKWATIDRSNAIEAWGRMRETTNQHFKFTPRTTAYCVIWALLVPIGIWKIIKWERQYKDRAKGRPPKDLF